MCLFRFSFRCVLLCKRSRNPGIPEKCLNPDIFYRGTATIIFRDQFRKFRLCICYCIGKDVPMFSHLIVIALHTNLYEYHLWYSIKLIISLVLSIFICTMDWFCLINCAFISSSSWLLCRYNRTRSCYFSPPTLSNGVHLNPHMPHPTTPSPRKVPPSYPPVSEMVT